MRFSFKILNSFFQNKLPQPKKLAELLTLHLAEVKEVLKQGNDFLFEIEIPTNRPDLFSHLVLAREIGAILKKKPKEIKPIFKEENGSIKKFILANVENKGDAPRYILRFLFDLKIAPSPKFLREILRNFRINPQNNLVDILNYVMILTGQPLHAFDYDKIEGKTLEVRRAKSGEKIVTLDGKTYTLDENILVIADKKGPLAIAGIKGGERAKITFTTKRVVIESANFDRKLIRYASKKLKIQSEAAFRFEHSPSPHLAKFALDLALSFLQKYTGAKIVKGEIDLFYQKPKKRFILLKNDQIERLLGIKIPQAKALKILKNLGFETKVFQDAISASPPSLRTDISLPEDLIEEIGKVLGYQNLPLKMPYSLLTLGKNEPILAFEEKLKEAFTSLGFVESQNYSFISEKEKKLFPQDSNFLIEVLNPPSENLNYLRPSLLFGILKAISLNQKLQDRLSFFEIGKIFFKNGKIFEEEKASGAIFGFKDIFFLKSQLQSLFEKIGIYSFEIFPSNDLPKLFPFFEKGASGKVIFQNKKELGFFGKISKEILDFYLIKAPVFAFELDLNSLFKLSSKKKFEPISPYPSTFRDLSIALPKEVLSFSLYQKLKKAGGKLLKNIELLDVYQGPPLPQDKKSLTFRLTFQSPKKPLLAKEVNLIIERIKKNLPKSWEIRD